MRNAWINNNSVLFNFCPERSTRITKPYSFWETLHQWWENEDKLHKTLHQPIVIVSLQECKKLSNHSYNCPTKSENKYEEQEVLQRT